MERAWETLPTASLNQVSLLPTKAGNELDWHNSCQEELRSPEFSFLNHCTIPPKGWLGIRLTLTSIKCAKELWANTQRYEL